MNFQSQSHIAMAPTGERMVPENSDSGTFWEHVYRYAFALPYARNRRVLDIACGEGYGSAALKQAGAANVIGVDISDAACNHARTKYGVDARIGSAEQIPLPDASVDLIVSFETIEHVPRPHLFLDECKRVLAPGGRLIVSTPNKGVYGQNAGGGSNPFHCSEMTDDEFATALNTRFAKTTLFGQRLLRTGWLNRNVFAAERSPWRKLRGFNRLQRALQKWSSPLGLASPTDDQRNSTVPLIVECSRNPSSPLNPYGIRLQSKIDRKNAIYLIAVADRQM